MAINQKLHKYRNKLIAELMNVGTKNSKNIRVQYRYMSQNLLTPMVQKQKMLEIGTLRNQNLTKYGGNLRKMNAKNVRALVR